MKQTSITVRYRNEPKGNGPASVKDDNGQLWKFWTKSIPMDRFEVGKSYAVGYDTEQYQGKDQFYIRAVSLPDTAPAQQNGTALPYMTQEQVRKQLDVNPAPAPAASYTKDEMIFVCGAINSSLKNASTHPTEITTAIGIARVNMWREIWAETFGKVPY